MRPLTFALVTLLALICAVRSPGRLPAAPDETPAAHAVMPKGSSDSGTKDDDDEDYRVAGA